MKLELDKPIMKSPKVGKSKLACIENFVDIPMSLKRKMYFAELALKEYYPERNSRLLPEIDIVKYQKKEEKDGHKRLYGRPDVSLKIEDTDLTYMSVIDYLRGRVAGVNVVNENLILIRGNTSLSSNVDLNPLILIDGVPSSFDLLRFMPMADIDKVEVLKSSAKAVIYGSRGANGVISILTRTGINANPHSYPLLHSAALERIKGFSTVKEFYSPKYTPESIYSPVPDYRTTLYWDPNVDMEKGGATVNFHTSDNVGNYKIIVEGITENGEICVGSANFAVDHKNELLGDK